MRGEGGGSQFEASRTVQQVLFRKFLNSLIGPNNLYLITQNSIPKASIIRWTVDDGNRRDAKRTGARSWSIPLPRGRQVDRAGSPHGDKKSREHFDIRTHKHYGYLDRTRNG